jgi:hypothetical protein
MNLPEPPPPLPTPKPPVIEWYVPPGPPEILPSPVGRKWDPARPLRGLVPQVFPVPPEDAWKTPERPVERERKKNPP